MYYLGQTWVGDPLLDFPLVGELEGIGHDGGHKAGDQEKHIEFEKFLQQARKRLFLRNNK